MGSESIPSVKSFLRNEFESNSSFWKVLRENSTR